MDLAYYPGCTLKTRAKNFETSALAVMSALGINLVELPRWNCCGTVYSLAEDDLIHHVAAVRNLIRVKEQGKNKVVTLCAFCYNTLKRANLVMKDSPDKRFAINTFMDEEPDYAGEVETVHLLQVLRDDVGWEKIAGRVKHPLKGLKIAGYYGCTLLRPQSVAIDSVERPTILQDLLKALGSTAVDFPFATECCGAFQIVNNRDIITERTSAIFGSAVKNGVEAIAVSCPLCEYNLRQTQSSTKQPQSGVPAMPTLYFTQLMALAFGLDSAVCGFEENSPETRTWLKSKRLIS
ncbi:MAG TPA: CoB--CoM heterodisulfide reductase iron-sulfur subunit B family protein [Dehalococcoidales bacterium]